MQCAIGMVPATLVELDDVTGKPKVKLELPSPLRLGDRLQLRFRLSRQNGGRAEVLDVTGEYTVRSVSFDASDGPARQIISVVTTGVTPSWKAVKKASLASPRKLGPTRWPPMVLE